MPATLPPLTGGYPVVAVVSVAGEHRTCGYVIAVSDDTGCEIVETGAGTLGPELNELLAEKIVTQATQRMSLIRTWRPPLDAAVAAAGGEDYLDVPDNVRTDDPTYLALADLAAELCETRADARERSGFGGKAAEPLVIAVDGSRSRAGIGAWAWINENGKWDTGAGEYTSPLHAEVSAISAALTAHPSDRALRILCDSRDAIGHVTRALAGAPIAPNATNTVARILSAITRNHQGRPVTLEWVKGHNGHPLNDRADRLAVHARRTYGGDPAGFREVADSIAELATM